MSKQVLCDKCGSAGAHDYSVNISGLGVVADDRPTACQFAMELCDNCRDTGLGELYAKTFADFTAAIPVHKEAIRIAGDISEMHNALKDAVIARDAFAERTSIVGDDGKRYVHPDDAQKYKAMDEVVVGIQSQIEAAQQRRLEVLEKGIV